MFTGIVQQTGRVKTLARVAGGWQLRIAHSPWENPLEIGESVAVQGACLTVVEARNEEFIADLLDETFARTALSSLSRDHRVNLERALRLGDRVGGHMVSGHVDETGSVKAIESRGRDFALRIACSSRLSRLTIFKGSIAIDGVSLTVTELDDGIVGVAVIPHTWRKTSLGDRRLGDLVNLESDLLGKYVARLLGKEDGPVAEASPKVSFDLLARAGFG